MANYQVGKYAEAARDLRQNVAGFPNSDTVLDSTFLLAVTVGTQANLAASKDPRTAADTEEALKGYVEAERLLGEIIKKRTDLALANDAEFQLGETLAAHAAASPAGAQKGLYERALAAYRAVEPKAGMIAAQTARVQRINDARIAELRKGAAANRALTRQLDQQRLLEQGKLEALQAKDDPVLTARIKGGAVYCSLQEFDEARVLMDALLPVVTKADDEKAALAYVVLSYAGQGLDDKAVAAYEKFQAKYAGDPVGERLPLVIGSLFLTAEKPDAARANQYFAEFAKLYPKSRLRETVLLEQAAASASLGRYDEALKTLNTFLAGKPKRELQATAELARARILKDKKDLDGALTAFRKVQDAYKDLPEGAEAGYWVGATLLQKKDAAGAVAELKDYVDKNPQGKFTPVAMLTLGGSATGNRREGPGVGDAQRRVREVPRRAGSHQRLLRPGKHRSR